MAFSATVNSHWLEETENSETDRNIDAVHGAGQLSGRRMDAIVSMADWLTEETGVKVTLYAGAQEQLAEGETQALFTEVTVDQEYAVGADKARGTYANLGLRVAGQDLYLGLEAGPAKIGVVGGTAAIDGDGIAATEDYV